MDFLTSTAENDKLNQYWYSAKSIADLVAAAAEATAGGGRAAFLSTPSLYFGVPAADRVRHAVFDFDRQWESDPGYRFYDFNRPEAIEEADRGAYDVVVIDPPFITEPVWRLYAEAARLLLRPASAGAAAVPTDGAGGSAAAPAGSEEGAPAPAAGGSADAAVVSRRGVICTTVAENKALLAELFPGCVRCEWQPSIPHLVYQYDSFTSVSPVPAVLAAPNPEIP